MKNALRSYASEPLSRTELWLGVITVYIVVSAFFMGRFAAQSGAADSVAPVSQYASQHLLHEPLDADFTSVLHR